MGERTFEIKSWGTKDGYSTATVNWLESTDTAETEEEAAECAQKVRNPLRSELEPEMMLVTH